MNSLYLLKVKTDGRCVSIIVLSIIGNRPPVHNTDGRNYKGVRKLTWVPVRRAEPKAVRNSDDSSVSQSLKLAEERSAQAVESSPGESDVDKLRWSCSEGKG